MGNEQLIERVRNMVREASQIVVLLGVGTIIESGGENIWSSRECYRLEDIYHKSPDEMMSVGFYSARRDKFFEFYRNEIISANLEPASLYYDLKRLQDQGKVKKIITQNTYGLHNKVGLEGVIELHGNIHNNWCPHCGKKGFFENEIHCGQLSVQKRCTYPLAPPRYRSLFSVKIRLSLFDGCDHGRREIFR